MSPSRLVMLAAVLLAVLSCAVSGPLNSRPERSPSAQNKEIKLSVVLNMDEDEEEGFHEGLEEPALFDRTKRSASSPLTDALLGQAANQEAAPSRPIRRSKRHISRGRHQADDLDSLIDAAATATGGSSSRSRRSAAWWLHATIHMCNKNAHLCKSIQVEEDNMKMEIRIESE